MFANEFVVLDAASPLWQTAQPLLDVALKLDYQDTTYVWHGWDKQQIEAFLATLPSICSLIVGVWAHDATTGEEQVKLGIVCEVADSQIRSLRTFAALTSFGLKPIEQLEPSSDDALEIMRIVRIHIAPVAWALFTDQATWGEWLCAEGDNASVLDKSALLAALAQRGRCVILSGSRSASLYLAQHASHDQNTGKSERR